MVSTADELDVTWSWMRRFLPFDLDGLAMEKGALQRRRGVRHGENLLRTFLLYGLPKGSMQRAAAEAKRLNLANVSGPALFGRLVQGQSFLESVFEHLMSFSCDRAEKWNGYRLVAIDATTLCGPGATATDQRLHVAYDLGEGRPIHLELTDKKGGETFRRFLDLGKGVLALADQCYGNGPGIVPLLKSGASVLVRFNFHSIRLLDSEGAKITPEQAESMLPSEGTVEFAATLPGWNSSVRIFGARNPEGKGVWLLTNLIESELHANEVRSLYSRRWQIELFFKRMKSVLDLDELPTRDGPTVRSWIWIKLILAGLAVLIGHERFSPWGSPDRKDEGATEPHPGVGPCGNADESLLRKRGRPRKTRQEREIPAPRQSVGHDRPGGTDAAPRLAGARQNRRTTRAPKRTQRAPGSYAETGSILEALS